MKSYDVIVLGGGADVRFGCLRPALIGSSARNN